MATSVFIDLRDYGEDYIKVRFDVEVTWAATYKVKYGIYETGEERTSGNFTLENGGTYTTSTSTFSGLRPGTVYTVWVSLWNAGTNKELGVTDELPVETDGSSAPTKPDEWVWSTSIVIGDKTYGRIIDKGEAIPFAIVGNNSVCVPLTASEWNRFIDRIFEFMDYKGKSYSDNASDYYVTSGTDMKAADVDSARQLIARMNPPTALPSEIKRNVEITADYINGLKNSLNSIE
jgi:hypothetical protein